MRRTQGGNAAAPIRQRCGLTASAVFLCASLPVLAFSPKQPRDDYATMSLERLFSCSVDDSSMHAQQGFQAWWTYASFPGFSVLGKNVFMAAEIDGMDRRIDYLGVRQNRSPMTRIGLFAGVTVVKRAKHSGSFMVGTGVSSDFVSLHRDAAYVHLIYDHRFDISQQLSAGLGILVMYNFDRWQRDVPFYLLPTLRWRVTPTTIVRVAWDNLEIKQFVTERFALAAEARYDFSFFRLDNNTTLEFETVAVGGGLDVWVGGDMYVRVRYKELVYKNELLERDGTVLVDDVSRNGRGVKIAVVYAK